MQHILDDLRAIEMVTGVTIDRRSDVSAGERWESFKKAETAWKSRVGKWLTDNYGAIMELRRKVRRGKATDADKAELEELERQRKLITASRHLSADRRKGFISLPKRFVVAMEEAGFTWATDFSTGADIMHFEYRGHRQARVPRSARKTDPDSGGGSGGSRSSTARHAH